MIMFKNKIYDKSIILYHMCVTLAQHSFCFTINSTIICTNIYKIVSENSSRVLFDLRHLIPITYRTNDTRNKMDPIIPFGFWLRRCNGHLSSLFRSSTISLFSVKSKKMSFDLLWHSIWGSKNIGFLLKDIFKYKFSKY